MDPRLAAAADDLRAAIHDARSALADLRVEVDTDRQEPLLTEEDERQVQEVAQRGDMGRDMREFSEEVRRGNADWTTFLQGRDPEHNRLLQAFVQRSQDEYGEQLADAFADSEAPDDVDDPRDPRHRPGAGPTGLDHS